MISALIAWFLTGGGDPSLAMSQAWIESKGDSTVVSRAKGGRFCGIWQTQARTKAECEAMRCPLVAARAYRRELRAWLRATRGDLPGALRGYGCSWAASRPGGTCRGYDERVLAMAKRLRAARARARARAASLML